VFLMEQSSEMYHPSLYVFAKFTAEVPSQLFFVTVTCCITYFMIDLYRSVGTFFVFFCILQLLGLCGYAFGVMASAVLPTADAALIFAPLIIMPLAMVGGLFANTERLDPYWVWLNYISFPRYTFMALIVNQFRSVDTLCPSDPVNGTGCVYRTGEQYIRILGFQDWEWWYSIFGLVGLLLLFLFLAALGLTILGLGRRGALTFNFDTVEGQTSDEEEIGGAAVPKESLEANHEMEAKE